MEEMSFEEMKSQIALLKEKIEKQELVNDKMMKEVLHSKNNTIKSKMKLSIMCAIIVIIISPFYFHSIMGVSWWFVLCTDVLMLYCIVREYQFKERINNTEMMSDSMLNVVKNTQEFKKDYKRFTLTNIFVLLPLWFACMVCELLTRNEDRDFAIFLIAGCSVGMVIGGVIGFSMYLKIQKTASEIAPILLQFSDKGITKSPKSSPKAAQKEPKSRSKGVVGV